MVDVANHTLEQLVYTDESETRGSYAAVLTAGKNRDLRYLQMSRKRDVLIRPYSPPVRTGTSGIYDGGRDVNQITKTVELDKRGSADSGPRKVREMAVYHPGEALGKRRGFGRRDVGYIYICVLHKAWICAKRGLPLRSGAHGNVRDSYLGLGSDIVVFGFRVSV